MTDEERRKEVEKLIWNIYRPPDIPERSWDGWDADELIDNILEYGNRCREEERKRCAKICEDSVEKKRTGDGLGYWNICKKTPYELRDEILNGGTTDER